MWRLSRWLFARLYVRSVRKWGQANAPLWSAIAGVSLVMGANLLALGTIAFWVLGMWTRDWNIEIYVVALALLLHYLNYRRFAIKREADELIKKLERQRRGETRRQETWLWCYIIGSLAAPMAVTIVRKCLE